MSENAIIGLLFLGAVIWALSSKKKKDGGKTIIINPGNSSGGGIFGSGSSGSREGSEVLWFLIMVGLTAGLPLFFLIETCQGFTGEDDWILPTVAFPIICMVIAHAIAKPRNIKPSAYVIFFVLGFIFGFLSFHEQGNLNCV